MSVYFITARELDMVKIGYAYNPIARYNHLRVASPAELTLEGAIPGGFDKEHELHVRYAKWRVRGEWFTLVPSIQSEIDASSKPAKFTWAAVRVWLRELEEKSEALRHDSDMLIERRRVLIEEHEKRVIEDMKRTAERSRMTELERLEAAGVIHFPFRAKVPA